MTDKTQPTAHAEITAPFSADLRGIEGASPVSQAVRLLREAAAELKNCHTIGGDWGDEIEALDAYNEHMAVAATLEQAEAGQAVPAPVTYMATDNACKWAWDQVRKDVGTEGWTTSDSCNFYGFFLWGWNYRGQYETQRLAAPPAPAAVAVPAPIAAGMKAAADMVQEQADLYIAEHAETDPDTGAVIWHHRDYGFDWHNGLEELAQKLRARAALAAAPAQPAAWMTPEGDRVVTEATMASARKDGGAMLSSLRPFTVALARAAAPAQAQDDRAAFKAYLQECDDCEIVPDVAGAFHAAWQKRAAPAQAVAVPDETTHEYGSTDLGWSTLPPLADGEKRLMALITNLFGNDHQAFNDLDALVNRARLAPITPAQEHATQLAGIPKLATPEMRAAFRAAYKEGGFWSDRLDYALDKMLAAAPAQAQEDARDAARYRYWKQWWVHEDSETAQLPKTVEQMLEDLDIDAAFDAAIDAARAAQGGA